MDTQENTVSRSRNLIMMAQPTKFNDMASGAVSSKPTPLSSEDINKLVNKRSLQELDSTDLVNALKHPVEKAPETPNLPLAA